MEQAISLIFFKYFPVTPEKRTVVHNAFSYGKGKPNLR